MDLIVSVDIEGNNRFGDSLPTSIGVVVCDVKTKKVVESFFVALPQGEPDQNTLDWIKKFQDLFDASDKLKKTSLEEGTTLFKKFAYYITGKYQKKKTQIWSDCVGYDIGRLNHLLGKFKILPIRVLFSNTQEQHENDACTNFGSEVGIDDVITRSVNFNDNDMQTIKDEIISTLYKPTNDEVQFHKDFWVQHNPLYDACFTALYYLNAM
jgi:hypothetical protein